MVWQFLIKLNIYPNPQKLLLLVFYPSKVKTSCSHKDPNLNAVHGVTRKSSELETTLMSINWWTDGHTLVHLFTRYCFSINLKKLMMFAIKLWTENTMLSAISQTRRLCTVIFHLYEILDKTKLLRGKVEQQLHGQVGEDWLWRKQGAFHQQCDCQSHTFVGPCCRL